MFRLDDPFFAAWLRPRIRSEQLMAWWLKRGVDDAQRRTDDTQVRRTKVESALADVEARGDAAVREMSVRFDGWDRPDYRLTEPQSIAASTKCAPRDLEGSTPLRQAAGAARFAEIQKGSLRDVEQETLPGVILGTQAFP